MNGTDHAGLAGNSQAYGRGRRDEVFRALSASGYFTKIAVSSVSDPNSSFCVPANRTVIGGDARHRAGDDRGNAWLTPEAMIEDVRRAHGGQIDLDPATEASNPTGARRFYTVREDGLKKSWRGRIFLNPPYSPVEPWIDKAVAEAGNGAKIFLLLPIRLDALYHHRLLAAATDVLILKGRVRFARADGGEAKNPAFGSMIVGLNVSCKGLEHLGTLLTRKESSDAGQS